MSFRRGHRLWVYGALVGAAAAIVVLLLSGHLRARAPEQRSQGTLLPEASGALGEIVMHYVPSMEPLVLETYTDFLRALPDEVRVQVVVAKSEGQASRQRLAAFLSAIDPSGGLAARSRVVETQGPITTWSKDRALVSAPPLAGRAASLIAPAEPSKQWAERHHDWATVPAIAAASGGLLRLEIAPLDFDAGDFAVTDDTLIVDTNLLAKNRHRGVGDVVELRKRLAAYFRMPVVVLGQDPGDTPRHHLSMYMTPLHDNVVLVGDPALARGLVGEDFEPGAVSIETAEPLRGDFSAASLARFQRAADDLERRGFHVERIPNVPLEDKTYLSYTNGVYETRGGQRIAYMPVYGNDVLDRAARDVYERLGWEVRPIRVGKIFPHHGTIGCLVNVLSRK